jgi:hypothetical protein
MYSSKYEDRYIGAGMRTHAGGERRGERREERGERREERAKEDRYIGVLPCGQICRRSTNRRGVS